MIGTKLTYFKPLKQHRYFARVNHGVEGGTQGSTRGIHLLRFTTRIVKDSWSGEELQAYLNLQMASSSPKYDRCGEGRRRSLMSSPSGRLVGYPLSWSLFCRQKCATKATPQFHQGQPLSSPDRPNAVDAVIAKDCLSSLIRTGDASLMYIRTEHSNISRRDKRQQCWRKNLERTESLHYSLRCPGRLR